MWEVDYGGEWFRASRLRVEGIVLLDDVMMSEMDRHQYYVNIWICRVCVGAHYRVSIAPR